MLRQTLKYWLPVAIWSAAIVIASGPGLAADNTGALLERVVVTIFGHPLPPEVFFYLHVLIRKLGHVTEYAILGGLAFRAARGDAHGFAWRWALTAVVVCLVVSSCDEWRQSFVPTRTASPRDVLLDVVAASLMQLAIRYSMLSNRFALFASGSSERGGE